MTLRPPAAIAPAAVRDWYAMYREHDIDGMCRLAHPRIVVAPQKPLLYELPGTTFHGHAGLRTLMRWVFGTFPEIRVETKAVRDVAGFALATARFVAGDQPGVVVNDVHSLFDISEGTIRRVYSFESESAAVTAASRSRVLTPREREVFQLVARGLTLREIADELVLSPATVRTHVRNGIVRLGAANKVHAVSLALKRHEITA